MAHSEDERPRGDAVAQATLPSSEGYASLRIDFVRGRAFRDQAGFEAVAEITAPNWNVERPALNVPCRLELRGLWLRTEAVREMLAAMDAWLQLPLEQLRGRKFTGAFELSAFCGNFALRFGDDARPLSTLSQLVWMTANVGMNAECRFRVDLTCMDLFADDLRKAVSLH